MSPSVRRRSVAGLVGRYVTISQKMCQVTYTAMLLSDVINTSKDQEAAVEEGAEGKVDLSCTHNQLCNFDKRQMSIRIDKLSLNT